MTRTLLWFSGGAASAAAARMVPNAILVRCETGNEDEDNHRFERDVETWLQRTIQVLKSDKYASVPEVWRRERYMAGIEGAKCTVEMKIKPRLEFQRPTDVHVFGYTADSGDVERFARLKANYPELTVRAPLIEHGVTKQGALAMIERAGIALPRSYAMGFPNANCLQSGCVKATSASYWALYRKHFPVEFARTAALARELDVRLCRMAGERAFIDDIPADWAVTKAIAPACDFLCQLAELER